MSKMIVYTLRTGTHEYRVTPEKWEQMLAKNPRAGFNKIREEDEAQVKVGEGVQVVDAAPNAPTKARAATKKAEPKEVRTPAPVVKATEEKGLAENEETNPEKTGN